MKYLCKRDKINQTGGILENNYKTTITELDDLKGKYKEVEKEKKGVEKNYASLKEVCWQTKILSEQAKTNLKNIHQEKELSEEFIKALRSIIKTKIDSVSDQAAADTTITDKFLKR